MDWFIWLNVTHNQSPVSHCQRFGTHAICDVVGCHLPSFRDPCPASQSLILADQNLTGGICRQPGPVAEGIKGSYRPRVCKYSNALLVSLGMPRRCLVRNRLQSLSPPWVERELVRPCTTVLEESIKNVKSQLTSAGDSGAKAAVIG